jgi:hypothetical protein
MRRTVQAAHAAEQPGVRVLRAAGTDDFPKTRMAATKVSVEALKSLEPLSSLSDARLKELADLYYIAFVGRNLHPFHLRSIAGQSVYMVRGELALAYNRGSSEVIVGGSAEARYALDRRRVRLPRPATARARQHADSDGERPAEQQGADGFFCRIV